MSETGCRTDWAHNMSARQADRIRTLNPLERTDRTFTRISEIPASRSYFDPDYLVLPKTWIERLAHASITGGNRFCL
jgi:hypothetical protein